MSTTELYDKKYYKDYDLLLNVPVYQRLINKVAELTQPEKTDKILIIGIGTGNEAKKILEKQKPELIIGVDNSKKMLEIAAKKNPSIQLENSNLQDFETQQKFDKIISIRILDHLENIEEGITKITRLIKKNGKIIITLPLGADVKKIWKESLTDIKNLILELEFKKVTKGIIAGIKTGKHSKKLFEQRKQNSKKTKQIINYIRQNYYVTYKKRVYGEQDILICAVKK